MVENLKVVRLSYDLYIPGDNNNEELMERATAETPLTYCHGEGMMLPAFEHALEGKNAGDDFDFVIPMADAYGEYEEEGVMELDKRMFFNGDGEFDSERVFLGAIVPMNTVDGQIVKAQVIEITDDKVTIDLNHPLAGEDLHFVGKIIDIRDVTEGELQAIRHPHHGCGGCHGGNCGEGGCGGNCGEGGCEGGCGEGGCEGGCGEGGCEGGCGNCKD